MLNVAVIGAGRIGRVHAANMAAVPGIKVVHIADALHEAAASLAAQCGASPASVDAIMDAPDIAGVVIASPTPTHASLIERAAAAGKAVFCEKPIDLDTNRARECIAAVEAAGVPLLLGFNRRFDIHFAELKARLDAGEIGKVEMIQITSRDPSPPPPGYIGASGGLFRDMMIHDLDMARWLLGEEPVSVVASASCLVDPAIGAAGDVDSAVVTLRTASGRLCTISNSRRAVYGYDQRLEVHGATGLLSAGNVRENSVRCATVGGESTAPLQNFFIERYREAYRREAEHFAAVLRGEVAPLVTGVDGVRALELADAAQAIINRKDNNQ